MDIKNSKVLVIGGAGFIGSFVVSELLKTNVGKVVIYDNFARGKASNISNSMADPRCEIYPNGGDVRDVDTLSDAMQGCDGVIHLAAMWLLHCKDFPRTAFHVNIEGTFNVLEACVKNNIKRFVYSSSASVYGDASEVPMTELHPFNNKNFYGATKIAGEAMCRAYYDRYGLSYVGLRYMNVYGPHQDQTAAYTGVIPIMLNKIDANEAPTINGDGTQAYDFIDVEDVARCNINALEAEVTDEFYNVGTGIQTTIKEFATPSWISSNPSLRLPTTLTAKTTLEDGTKSNRVPKESFCDLGFTYKYELRTGLQRLIDWRKSNLEEF